MGYDCTNLVTGPFAAYGGYTTPSPSPTPVTDGVVVDDVPEVIESMEEEVFTEAGSAPSPSTVIAPLPPTLPPVSLTIYDGRIHSDILTEAGVLNEVEDEDEDEWETRGWAIIPDEEP